MAGERVNERFWEKVSEADGGCWEWTAKRERGGYGRFWDGRVQREVPAHRFAYEVLRAEIPEGLQLDHLCRNRACVNPWHLEPVTARVNSRRSEGFPGTQSRQGECLRGHFFSLANTYVRRDGSRNCKACANDNRRARRQRARIVR